MSDYVSEVSDQSFEKDVLQSDRPVLVDFWAQWCAPCRMLAPTVEAVAEKYQGQATVVKLNVDDNPAVSQRYGIKGIPTLILFKGGKEEERVVGATSKDAISRMLDKHVAAAARRAFTAGARTRLRALVPRKVFPTRIGRLKPARGPRTFGARG